MRAQHAIERHAEQQQRMRREHQAAFEHLRHDLGGARLRAGARCSVSSSVRTITGSSGAQRAARGAGSSGRSGVSANVIATARALREPGGHQRLAPRRVAVDDAAAVGGRLAHALRDRSRARRTGCPRARAGARGSGRCGRSRRRSRDPAAPSLRAAICVICAARASQSLAVSLRTIGSANWISERRREHRQDHRREHQLQRVVRHEQLVLRRERQQHERELAGLREIEAGAQRRRQRRAEQPREHDDSTSLASTGHDQQRQHPARCCARRRAGRAYMPTVTKNRPSSTSRNGLMSSSTW